MASQVLHLDPQIDSPACSGGGVACAFPLRPQDHMVITKAALEIASTSAWLTWQIDAHDVTVDEALYQLKGLNDTLARHAGRLPDDERRAAHRLFAAARKAAAQDNLDGVARSLRQLRVDMDNLRRALADRS